MKQYKLIKEYPGSPKLGIIRQIETVNNRIITNDPSELYDIYPEFWKEIKQPLFITEDKVEIFEDNIILFYITNSWKISTFKYINEYCIGISSKIGFDKYFSTEKAANEYILMNKPCLSILDVIRNRTVNDYDINKLKELVKSKL